MSLKSTICLVHYTSAPGGIELLMPEIISSFPGEVFSVFIIRPPEIGKYNVYNGLPVKINYGSGNNLVAALRLWRFAIRNRSAIFHGFNTGPFFLFIIRLAGIGKAAYSIRGTLHYRGDFQRFIRKTMWHMALSSRYRLIANSEYSREVFLNFISSQKHAVTVLYNPVNSLRIKLPLKKAGGDGLNIIYIGRLAEGKNLSLWLEIAESIHRIRSDSKFYIYGDGVLRDSLMRQSVSKGMQDYVYFMGFRADLTEAYQVADLMLFLSEYESFGNSVVESILFGTPVIACDIPSIREIFRDFPQFLVQPGQSLEYDIISKIDRLDELNKLVPEAAKQFSGRFSLKQHSAGLQAVYCGLRSKNNFHN